MQLAENEIARMQIVLVILTAVLFALFYLPVYMPFLLSFRLKSPDWREVRWALRAGAAACLFIALIPPPGFRDDFGDDVGGNFAGAVHNFPIMLAWVWGGGLACNGICLVTGFVVRAYRRRVSSPVSAEIAK